MSYREERVIADKALADYMEAMDLAHKEACGRDSTIQHGTEWCRNQATAWAIRNDLNHRDHNETSKWPGWNQFMFIRDDILSGIFGKQHICMWPPSMKYEDQVGASVPDVVIVGEHRSKSIILPVMQFKWRDILMTTRCNFHDWKVCIEMPLGLDPSADLLDIAAENDHLLHPVYFEGFPEPYIYRPIADGDFALTGQFATMFGASSVGYHKMWMFFWLMKRWYEDRFGALDQP